MYLEKKKDELTNFSLVKNADFAINKGPI